MTVTGRVEFVCVKKRQKGEGLYVIEMERRNTCSGGKSTTDPCCGAWAAAGPTKLCRAVPCPDLESLWLAHGGGLLP